MIDLYITYPLMQENFGVEPCIMQEGYGGCDNISIQSFQNLTCLVEHQMVLITNQQWFY